jgi:hypothetical protein
MFGEKGERRMTKHYLQHLKSSEELRTSYEAIRAGFVSLALEKNRRATPFVAEARALKSAASLAKVPSDLLSMAQIRPALLTASGLSDKSLKHLQDTDQTEAIAELIRKFLEPSGANFVEELVFRFLLTRGDTLGGSMRNAGGVLAQRRLNRAIIASLRLSGAPLFILRNNSSKWDTIPSEDADIEIRLRGLSWTKGKIYRTLIMNLTVPLFKNNVDLCLFDCSTKEFSREVVEDPRRYVALGELKGGIDPAGADEHWKTAGSALGRISRAFAEQGLKPHTFFVGGAIEAKMADEIWAMLETGVLENAANLTDDGQIASMARWICSV